MDQGVQISAARLGFKKVPCTSCASAPDRGCANCEGVGFVWRQGLTTLARSGLGRLVRTWPAPTFHSSRSV
jgi:hypothetical protein